LRSRASSENSFSGTAGPLTLAQPGVGPLEAGGHDVADVGEVEEEERHADDGVEDRHQFADGSHGRDVTVS